VVDGFDASFAGWGREDSDLLIRLLHAGVRRKDGRFATGVIHLWHPEADREQLTANDDRLEAVLRSDRTRAERGLSALRDAAGPGEDDRGDDHVRAQS
jgi:predicted glycosyltransferase involved in capsule biosynthesis